MISQEAEAAILSEIEANGFAKVPFGDSEIPNLQFHQSRRLYEQPGRGQREYFLKHQLPAKKQVPGLPAEFLRGHPAK